jgi:ABC-type Fe3+-siderophore transport system permease subunit
VLPLFFVAVNVAIFINSVIAQPLKSMIGLVMLGIGIPAFLYWKRRAKKLR